MNHCYTGKAFKAVHTSIINSAASALSRLIKSPHTRTSILSTGYEPGVRLIDLGDLFPTSHVHILLKNSYLQYLQESVNSSNKVRRKSTFLASSEITHENNGSKRTINQTIKQTMAEESTTRKITLREFKPESYKVWEMSTKATLKYNKLFNIVDGTETDPTPRDDDGTILRPIPAATRDQVKKWKHDHERAREAIIRCLPDSELLKLDDIQDDVTAIWKRLRDEYGRSSNLEYIRASNNLANLKKDEKTTINDHINKFEQLVYEVNYNKLSDTKNTEESVLNLKFLNTLMVDKTSSDKWETFINAKGPQLETMSTQQLYAEVRVNAGRIKPVEPVPNEVKALQTEVQQSLQALATRFDTFQRNNDRRNNGKGGRGSNKGNSRNNGLNNGRNNGGNNSGRKGKNNRSPRRYPYDTNKSCELHGRGHSTDECITLKKQAREQQSSDKNQHNQRYL